MRSNSEIIKSNENMVLILETVTKNTGIKFWDLYLMDWQNGELLYGFKMSEDNYLYFFENFCKARESLK